MFLLNLIFVPINLFLGFLYSVETISWITLNIARIFSLFQ